MKIKNLMACLALFAAMPILFASCSSYDEDDCTIIEYLKINDLLEKKLAGNSADEVLDFMQAYSNATWENMFDYDEEAVKSFAEKYYVESSDTYKVEKLEADITSELWNYFNMNYSKAIPAKAQNPDEGRYYTIAELKKKYPDYKEFEIKDFRPVELVNSVMSEKLFEFSLISKGDVNLRTLYVFYLLCKNAENSSTAGQSGGVSDSIDYKGIIAAHFGGTIPADVNVNEAVATFKRCIGKDGLYKNTRSGFESFVVDYFETDIFTGADAVDDVSAGQGGEPLGNIDYKGIIAAHFDGSIPAFVNVNEVIATFKQCTGKDGLYKNTSSGFKEFVFTYFETDEFTGEDEMVD